jgi:hypothetical protein
MEMWTQTSLICLPASASVPIMNVAISDVRRPYSSRSCPLSASVRLLIHATTTLLHMGVTLRRSVAVPVSAPVGGGTPKRTAPPRALDQAQCAYYAAGTGMLLTIALKIALI